MLGCIYENMYIILNESQINEVSQSKKISKYIGFDTAIDWYAENRERLAGVLGVPEENLPMPEQILSWSDSLVNDVINPQRWGRNRSSQVKGFEKFNVGRRAIIQVLKTPDESERLKMIKEMFSIEDFTRTLRYSDFKPVA